MGSSAFKGTNFESSINSSGTPSADALWVFLRLDFETQVKGKEDEVETCKLTKEWAGGEEGFRAKDDKR